MTRRMEMKIKDFIYKYSIRLFVLIVAYLIVSFPFQYTQEKMNDVSQPVRWLGTLLFFIIACFIVRYRKKLEAVFAKKSLFFIIFVMIFALQLMTIYVFKIQPVNDLLYLHDEAIRMIQNPMISLQRFGGYFAHYPNNYGYLLILYCYYKLLVSCGISVGSLVLAGNFLNLLVIDIGILCGYIAIRIVKNIKLANIWMLLFLLNPWTYFWIAYYYTHTISFGMIMVLLLLFVLIHKEKDNWKGILYSAFLGIVIYIGIKIRITNLILCIAVGITLFIFWKQYKFKVRHMCLILGIAAGIAVSVFGYQYKFQNMIPKQNTQEFPATHWLMMSSHGVGRYDSEDVRFTTELPTQEAKKEMTVQRMKENYKELGVKGSLRLFGTKLRSVWLVGDDDFTKMTYVSSDYRHVNEYLNGKYNGWILMYSYLARFILLCCCLISAVKLIRQKDKWVYVAMLSILGGMVFHIFWEANPKYSICFMGMMTFVMLFGIESISQFDFKESGLLQKKNIPVYLIIAGGILCLQPMYDYLVYNPQAYDKSYAVNQYTESQVLSLSVKKGDTIDQSFYSYIKFKEIMINIRNLKETTDIRLNLKNKKGQIVKSDILRKADYDGNTLCWNLKESLKPGKYFVEIMFESPQDNVNLPIYDTANYDVYPNGYVCIQGRKKKNADLFFSVSDGKR